MIDYLLKDWWKELMDTVVKHVMETGEVKCLVKKAIRDMRAEKSFKKNDSFFMNREKQGL
jgi:hypothetical protein